MGLPARQGQFEVDRSEMGKADTLRFNVSTFVVDQQYDRAIQTLRDHLDKESEYPQFRPRVERYVEHAVDLVNAIRAKRNFPGAQYLTMAKQQELNERFRQHFAELQLVLKKIEKVQIDLKLDDIRSTAIVVKTIIYCAFAILLIAFVLEASRGLGETTQIVIDDGFTRVADWIVTKIGG